MTAAIPQVRAASSLGRTLLREAHANGIGTAARDCNATASPVSCAYHAAHAPFSMR